MVALVQGVVVGLNNEVPDLLSGDNDAWLAVVAHNALEAHGLAFDLFNEVFFVLHLFSLPV